MLPPTQAVLEGLDELWDESQYAEEFGLGCIRQQAIIVKTGGTLTAGSVTAVDGTSHGAGVRRLGQDCRKGSSRPCPALLEQRSP